MKHITVLNDHEIEAIVGGVIDIGDDLLIGLNFHAYPRVTAVEQSPAVDFYLGEPGPGTGV